MSEPIEPRKIFYPGVVPKRLDAKPRQPRLPKPAKPSYAERLYASFLRKMVEDIAQEFMEIVLPAYEEALKLRPPEEPESNYRGDADQLSFPGMGIIDTSVLIAFRKAGMKYSREMIRQLVARNFRLTNEVQFGNWKLVLQTAGIGDIRKVTPMVSKVADDYLTRNVGYVKRVETRLLGSLRGVINESFAKGMHVSGLTQKIMDRVRVGKSDAERLAVDQTLKLFGKLNQTRQEESGIHRYYWRVSFDSRVRGRPDGLYPDSEYSHWARRDQIFEWNNPPPDGHPGEAIRCRCTAEPIIEDIL